MFEGVKSTNLEISDPSRLALLRQALIWLKESHYEEGFMNHVDVRRALESEVSIILKKGLDEKSAFIFSRFDRHTS